MTTELWMLAWSAAFSLIMWAPYVIARTLAWGLGQAVGYPTNPPPVPAWSERLRRSHANLIENLAPFAAIVLIAHVAEVSNGATVLGAQLFLAGRIVHAIVMAMGIAWLRTLAFAVAWAGTVLVFVQLY